MVNRASSDEAPSPVKRVAGAAALLVIFLLLAWNTGHAGFSSLLSAYAAKTSRLDIANAAVSLSLTNPDAHYVRGTILELGNDLPGAIAEYYQAAQARPDDYVLWLSLARARELNGETAGALAAARQAVPLAPSYAQPHWQLGNILLRAGQKDEAFKELRLAGNSNPTLMPNIIDLAWRVSGGKPEFVEQAIEPKSPEAYRALGDFFKKEKQIAAAVAMYAAAASGATEEDRRTSLAEIIAAKQFKEAYALWAVGRQAGGPGAMFDPGFEGESDLYEPGFGWRTVDNSQAFQLSLDTADPGQGRSSLRVDFRGDSDPGSPIISQLVLVEPHAHYQLRFVARTDGVVTGGLPWVVVIDANSTNALGQSSGVPQGTNAWREYTVDLETGPATSAIQVGLQRQSCNNSPCPIFGSLWLDNFRLLRL